jgi:hypothetical protein
MSKKVIYGLFDDEEVLLKSAKELVSKGIRIKDVFSPFPIHGIDPVIGVPRTRLAIMSFIFGATGLTLAWSMMGYMLIYDWPMDIGGKPSQAFYMNLTAFIPISFEMTVFCAAHGMALTYLIVNKLYPGQEPYNPDNRTTDDKFMIQINAADNKLSPEEITLLLRGTGVKEMK